jgi:hypothetical protein
MIASSTSPAGSGAVVEAGETVAERKECSTETESSRYAGFIITLVLQSLRVDDTSALWLSMSSLPNDMVLACVQEGHCHEVAVLEEAQDMEGGDDWPGEASTLAVKKREATASFFTMAAAATC